MSWFRKGSGRSDAGGGGTAVEKPQRSGNNSPGDTDPDTCLEVFKIHWKQALNIIQSPASVEGVTDSKGRPSLQSDDIETVIHNVEQMVYLIVSENSANGMPGTILLYLLEHEILEKFSNWCSEIIDYGERLKIEQLKMYEMLISQSKQLLLIHKPIIHPLLKLLSQCAESLEHYRSKDLERRVVLVLHQLCVCLSQQTLILESFFLSDADHGPAKFLIFSLLIPYVHREGNVGQEARDALLLIMALSAKHDNIGHYVAENSHFCPVLATGLSGLYSSLPRKLNIPADDWHQLSSDDISLMPDLQMFLYSLEFCNAVAQVAHPLVREQLISYIYNGFLVPVLGPALHQDVAGVPLPLLESRLFVNSRDEIIAATAYLELFLRRITEPAMLRAFLKFVIVGKYDEITVLDSLITRINTNSRLCVSSLSLFKTLVELNCEDVMFQLVFRYLIPCTHVMVSQRRAVKELDLYSKSAEKFLSLQPSCCLTKEEDKSAVGGSPNLNQSSLPAFSQSSDGVFDSSTLPVNHSFQSSDSALDLSNSAFSPHKSGLGFSRLFRSNSTLSRSFSTGRSKAVDSARGSSLSVSILSTQEQMETNYMDYLHEAQQRILCCAKACRSWSAPYDGELPPPDSDLGFTESVPSKQGELSKSVAGKPQNGPPAASTKSPSVPASSGETSGKSESETSSSAVATPPVEEPARAANETRDGDSVTRQTVSVSNTSSASSPLSDLSKCLDLESFMNYLNTVEVMSPSTPQEMGRYLEELDTMSRHLSCAEPMIPSTTGQKSAGEKPPVSPAPRDNPDLRTGKGEVKSDDVKVSRMRSSTDPDHSSTATVDSSVRPSSVGSASGISSAPSTGSKPLPRSSFLGAKYPSGTPNIGPFLCALLSKLEGMMQNSLYVNLLLTGLISRLACYPKPLLRSFLLNHNLVFQPSVKSLMQVLTSVRQKVDNFAATQPNFDVLLMQARKFLALREQMYLSEVNGGGQSGTPGSEKSSPKMVAKASRSQSVSEFVRGDKRRTSISDLLFKKSPAKDQKDRGQSMPPGPGSGNPVLERIVGGTGYRFVNTRSPTVGVIPENQLESLKTKNAVFCALILEEFVKELASLAQEHAVLSLDEGYSSS